MHDCKNCSGSCGGCAKELVLSPGEVHILRTLGQFPFLPVARRADTMDPVYLEDSTYSVEDYRLILLCLEKKALISLSYDKPLPGADMAAYKGFPVHGSMALTTRGQQVLDLLELQGITEE